MRVKRLFGSLAFLLLTSALCLAASPLGTAFTYQGRLNDGGQTANGVYDLRFAVFDAASGPAQIGGVLTNAATPVSNGLFTVILDFGPGVFTGEGRWLEIGVRTSGSPDDFTTLSPRQPLTPTPYAHMAGTAATVPNGAITSNMLAGGSVGAAQLAVGAVGSNQLAAGSVGAGNLAAGAAAANLAAGGQSGVASGGLVLSPIENNALLNAGYVKLGTTLIGDSWRDRDPGDSPEARSYHSAVWTGSEMIVWGGYDGAQYFQNGARYNPVANTWTPVNTLTAPPARRYHTAVWTGTEMIVWGGHNGRTNLVGGARYNPLSDTWISVLDSGKTVPAARRLHTAIWAGNEMIVWGGHGNSAPLNSGGRYNPVDNTWGSVTTVGAPPRRDSHTAVWTGSEMVV